MNTIINHQSKKMGFFAKIKDGLLAIPREHKGFGKQTFMLAKDDLIKNYKGAIIGPAWAIMKPLFQLFVYWFAFTVGLRAGAALVVAALAADGLSELEETSHIERGYENMVEKLQDLGADIRRIEAPIATITRAM